MSHNSPVRHVMSFSWRNFICQHSFHALSFPPGNVVPECSYWLQTSVDLQGRGFTLKYGSPSSSEDIKSNDTISFFSADQLFFRPSAFFVQSIFCKKNCIVRKYQAYVYCSTLKKVPQPIRLIVVFSQLLECALCVTQRMSNFEGTVVTPNYRVTLLFGELAWI